MKTLIKTLLTIVRNPRLSLQMIRLGNKKFYIDSHMSINKVKYFKAGEGLIIGKNSRFLFIESYAGQKYNPGVEIGNNVTIVNRFSLLSAAPISIGNNCLIASDVLITSENHGSNPELSDSYSKTPLIAKEVHIGEGCWIGEKACIMPGVTLGDRCIVAAGAIVTKSFPEYSLIGGCPAKIIKKYDFETHGWVNVK